MASLLWSPGPRPSPVFRSAVCDCLSLNVSVSLTTLIKKSERRRPRALLCHCIVGPACKPVVRVTVAAGGRGALQATARALGYIHTGRLMQTNHFSLFHLFSFLLLALLAGLHDVARARRLRRHLRVAEHQKIGASLLRESPPEREERQRDAHFGLRGGGCKRAQLQSPARVAAAARAGCPISTE